jgi:hypothetical protein
VYNISEDAWSTIPAFQHARQQHSVCQFNDKFLFVFGGKRLKAEARILGKEMKNGLKMNFYEPFEFVKEVEVYEIAKDTWKTINYISEPERLQILSPGSMQISSSQILLFGGLVPRDSDSNESQFDITENQVDLTLTAQSIILDVTVGSIKYGPELSTPAYFLPSGSTLPTATAVYCLGMSLKQAALPGMFQRLAAADQQPEEAQNKRHFELGASLHRKLIYCYNLTEHKWNEASESIFASGAQRKDSDINDD